MASKPRAASAANLLTYLVLFGTVVVGAGDDRVEAAAGETIDLSEADAAPLLKSETIKLAPAQTEAAPAPAPAPTPAPTPTPAT